jgi:threonine synthase
MAFAKESGFFNVATVREPYRVEGMKTMGFEVAEQCGWKLPDVMVYPTGGGEGTIGIWKAINEMLAWGWLPAESRAAHGDRAGRGLRPARARVARRRGEGHALGIARHARQRTARSRPAR